MSFISIIRSEISEIKSDKKALRSFGFVVGSVVLLIVGFSYWRRGFEFTTFAQIAGWIGVALITLGILLPKLLLPLQKIWMSLALVLGFIMTRVLLTIVYFLIVTPIGLTLRLLGKDPLTKRPDKTLATYWIDKEEPQTNPDRLKKYY